MFSSIPQYLRRSLVTVVRIYSLYEPIRVFWTLGGLMVLGGLILGARFLFLSYFYGPQGLIQSLILAAALAIIGVQTVLMGLVADLIASSRALSEQVLLRIRRMELRSGDWPDRKLEGASPLEGQPAQPGPDAAGRGPAPR